MIKSLSATITSLEARNPSRIAQAEKKRAERDKARAEALLDRVRQQKSEIESTLALPR